MPATEPRHFTRDKSLVADVADHFGGGGGNAEQLVEANQMRYSPELTAAQLLKGDPEASAAFETSDVAKAAGLDEEIIVSFERHGDYVVYSFETPDERVHKDTLVVNGDGELEDPYDGESPQRAAIRAQIEAVSAVSSARNEAEDILEKARAEADKIISEAAQEAEQKRQSSVQEANAAANERANADAGTEPTPEPDGKLTGEALDKRGKELEIEGFSSMNADEKRAAIAEAEKS